MHFVGDRRRGPVRAGPDHGRARRHRDRQRREGLRSCSTALRALGVTCCVGHDADARRRAPTPSSCRRRSGRTTPRWCVQASAGCGCGRGRLPCSPCMLGRTSGRRHRHPRQDDDDVDAGHGPARLRRRPVVRDRLDAERVGAQRGGRAGWRCSSPRATRATGRSSPTHPPGRSSPTSTSTTSTSSARSRPTPRCSTSSSTRIDPAVSSSAASTTPGAARLAERRRAALRTVDRGASQALGDDCDLPCQGDRVRR